MNVESFSNAWKGNLTCEECSTRLSVFRKKKVCYFCKNSFCQVCITRREDKKFCCRKCQILTARPLDRNKLLNLRSRDLINYLSSRQIPTNGCVEKEDLVNVLIKAVNKSCFHPSSTSYLDSGFSNSPRHNLHSSSHLPRHVDNFINDGIRITGHNSSESELNSDQTSGFETIVPLTHPTNEADQYPNISGVQNNRLSNETNVNNTETSHLNSKPNDAEGSENLQSNKPLSLSDIKSRSDLDALSVKQLKELLMRNRTDFKGCVERAELVQKVNRLWTDHIVSRKDLENLSLEELCKICMDAPIECVLLECGHMATCTSCGKQLCECPICRQFVVRCVRTFKA